METMGQAEDTTPALDEQVVELQRQVSDLRADLDQLRARIEDHARHDAVRGAANGGRS